MWKKNGRQKWRYGVKVNIKGINQVEWSYGITEIMSRIIGSEEQKWKTMCGKSKFKRRIEGIANYITRM